MKSRVARPAHADRLRSGDLAFSSSVPLGWSCRSRSPVDVPTYVEVSSWLAKPYSSRPPARARANASPRAGAKSANTADDVSAGASVKSGDAGTSVTRGCASSAGPAPRAAASAARTRGSSSSLVTAERETTPDAVPSRPSTVATTVSVRPRVTPFVVSALPAHRRLAVDSSSAITTQPSARDSSSARSTISCGLLVRALIDPPPAWCSEC